MVAGSKLFQLLLGLLAAGFLVSCSPRATVEAPDPDGLSLIPPSTRTPEPAIREAGEVICVNDARFVEDLTIPDGQEAEPGEELEKKWGVLNAGTCDWGAGYRLVRIDEGTITGREELALYPARAGETAVWSVQITAPVAAGQHVASWQAQSPGGALFGDPVFVLIEVKP